MELIVQRPNKRIYRRGQDVIKLFGEDVPASSVLSEATNHARAFEAGLPVPRLREVTKLDGKWAIVAEFIEGETLLERMDAEPENPEWLELFVRLQMEVHGQYIPKAQRLQDKLERKIAASGLDATTRYELQTRLEAMHPEKKASHGDFIPSNIILREGSAFILDWNQLTQGNAAADAANTWITLEKYGYPGLAAAYLKLYCERSDTARQHVMKWAPIVAGAALGDCPAGDRAFYLKWCEGVV
ncbi:MAG: phosphotransferase [Oscillospiraceae bacterium]|nr:phosphotransferase [Oscillospiraceae bacterium]